MAALSDEQLDATTGGCSGKCGPGKQPVLIVKPDGSYTVVCA